MAKNKDQKKVAWVFAFALFVQCHFCYAQTHFPNVFQSGSRQALEAAVQSILNRLTLPLTIDEETKDTVYFEYISKELKKIDPNVKIVPSGGVVRSILSHVYSLLYLDYIQDSKTFNAQTKLLSIAKESHSVFSFEIRGVGSDFDILLLDYTEANFSRLQRKASEITNSLEQNLNATSLQSAYKRSIFTIADVKSYAQQTLRSTSQGGSTLDYLAFDIEAGKFIEPKGHTDIVNLFLSGKFNYIKPTKPGLLEDPGKQAIRGLRALIELPFLELSEEAVLRRELQKIASGSIKLSSKALDQFKKMTRNSRFSAGNNRFIYVQPGTLEDLIKKTLKRVEETYSIVTVPEFIPTFPQNRQAKTVPNDLLIEPSAFLKLHTTNGVLFHGTPSMTSALAILRGGIIISGGHKKQGTFVHGSGGYSSKDKSTAQTYTGKSGLVIPLEVNPLALTVIDGKKLKDSPLLKELVSLYPNTDPHLILAEHYGVDFIVNHHTLILNAAAIDHPRDIRKLVGSIGINILNQINAEEISLNDRINTHQEYQTLLQYARVFNLELPSPPQFKIFNSNIDKPFEKITAPDRHFLHHLKALLKAVNLNLINQGLIKKLIPLVDSALQTLITRSELDPVVLLSTQTLLDIKKATNSSTPLQFSNSALNHFQSQINTALLPSLSDSFLKLYNKSQTLIIFFKMSAFLPKPLDFDRFLNQMEEMLLKLLHPEKASQLNYFLPTYVNNLIKGGVYSPSLHHKNSFIQIYLKTFNEKNSVARYDYPGAATVLLDSILESYFPGRSEKTKGLGYLLEERKKWEKKLTPDKAPPSCKAYLKKDNLSRQDLKNL